ncbi:g1332 [Coccomyxa elongata]
MQQTSPLYKQTYSDASVLVCRILDDEEDLTRTAASEQLMWLHKLHTAVDLVLRKVKATKVDITGEIMHFVSGTENGDEDHAASLVTLAQALMVMSAGMTLPSGHPLQLRMGLHSGQVVAGVVGNLALKYGVFGSTVAVARQLESLSPVGCLCASIDTVKRLPNQDDWVKADTITLPDWQELDIYRCSMQHPAPTIHPPINKTPAGPQLGLPPHSTSTWHLHKRRPTLGTPMTGFIWSFVPLGNGAGRHVISFQDLHTGFNRGPTHLEARRQTMVYHSFFGGSLRLSRRYIPFPIFIRYFVPSGLGHTRGYNIVEDKSQKSHYEV